MDWYDYELKMRYACEGCPDRDHCADYFECEGYGEEGYPDADYLEGEIYDEREEGNEYDCKYE